MLRFLTLIAALVVLAVTHIPAEAHDFLGKTLKAKIRYQGCGANGRCSQGSISTNIYFSSAGNIFDYGVGSQGSVVKPGDTVNGMTYVVSGNVFTARTADLDLNFAIRGRGCTVSVVVHNSGNARILSQSCSVVAGQSGR